jgi:hypothetical protein
VLFPLIFEDKKELEKVDKKPYTEDGKSWFWTICPSCNKCREGADNPEREEYPY